MRTKEQGRQKRKMHVRKNVKGTLERPRLSVYRSNKHIFAQLVDDNSHRTLAFASDLKADKGTNIQRAEAVGRIIAEGGKKAKVTKVIFDRNGYKYHGRVKALADAARQGGLEF